MILDLYAGGPSGWSTALAGFGRKAVGLEFDRDACATRAAIGHSTIRCDIATYPVAPFFGKVTGLTASPPCFTADTLILTARGLVFIPEVRVGDEVLTHLGRWRKVLAVGSRESETLTLKGQGASLRTTANHPIWSRDRHRGRGDLGHPEWTPAGGMGGKFWATPTDFAPLEVPPIGGRGLEFSPEFWWMVGRWLGDGWTRVRQYGSGQGNEVIICCAEDESTDLGGRLTEIAPTAGVRASSGELRWSCSKQRTTHRWTCSHNGLVEWLRREFGVGAHSKGLPAWVFGLSIEDRQNLLDGYVSADGGHDRRAGIIYAVTASKRLAISIRLLAESLGLESRLQFVPRPATHTIEGRTVNQSSWYRPSWRDAPTTRRFTHASNQHRWGLVRKVEAGPVERVWNLEVDEDNTYVADGIVVHNCQSFSASGKGEGRKHLDRIVAQIHDLDWSTEGLDDRTAHVLHTGRWVSALLPEWVCFEQVRSVQPIWDAYADVMREWGYSVWTGLLNAVDYGTPQKRIRSVLVASRVREVAMPEPTHAKDGAGGLLPWGTIRVSLGDSMGGRRLVPGSWADGRGGNRRTYESDEPAPTPQFGHDASGWKWSGSEWADRPATTVQGDARLWPPGHKVNAADRARLGEDEANARYGDRAGTKAVNMEPWEALVLQDFPADLPVQGSKTAKFRQIGNCIPVRLATAALKVALGVDDLELAPPHRGEGGPASPAHHAGHEVASTPVQAKDPRSNPVHAMTRKRSEGGWTKIDTRCGLALSSRDRDEVHAIATAWESDVSCPDCVQVSPLPVKGLIA